MGTKKTARKHTSGNLLYNGCLPVAIRKLVSR